ncbi:MAG: hypothetical protein UT34_C0002G0033 [candidate division WS6 bacterium GW2011_GWF2_39_15]|uniref:Uncharacterized protein n=1 Tax=candidate division WS6 bacterium GW2011_GWF2_39_15 TaxID=1619100 RepID=A0A0G0MYA0_9BACT|nr:MAG: hypothetical protein UT34_C0002G0033 [candidate division WS6 bacterium GW2011_GWF2_39_15]
MVKNRVSKNKEKISKDNLNFFIEAIARFCDKCGTPYSVDNLQIIQDNDFSSIIHFSCNNCKSRHIATFVKPIGVSSRMPVNSDLSVDEIAKFAKYNEVPADDILSVYTLLSKNPVIKL